MPSCALGTKRFKKPNAHTKWWREVNDNITFASSRRRQRITCYKVKFEGKGAVIKCEQPKPFRVGLDRVNKNQIDIITLDDKDVEPGIWNFSPCENQLGYRLPYKENGHTFMFWIGKQQTGSSRLILQDAKCSWLKSRTKKTKALIINSNLNKCKAPEFQTENFTIKGEMAERSLTRFPIIVW